jgi:hypothetical protein
VRRRGAAGRSTEGRKVRRVRRLEEGEGRDGGERPNTTFSPRLQHNTSPPTTRPRRPRSPTPIQTRAMAAPDQDAQPPPPPHEAPNLPPPSPHALLMRKCFGISAYASMFGRLPPEGGFDGVEAGTQELGQFLAEFRLGLHPGAQHVLAPLIAQFEGEGEGEVQEEGEEEEGQEGQEGDMQDDMEEGEEHEPKH